MFDFSLLYAFIIKSWNYSIKEMQTIYLGLIALSLVISFLPLGEALQATIKDFYHSGYISFYAFIIILFNPFYFLGVYKVIKMIKIKGKYKDYKEGKVKGELDLFYNELEKRNNGILDNLAITFFSSIQIGFIVLLSVLNIFVFGSYWDSILPFISYFVNTILFLLFILLLLINLVASFNLLILKQEQ